MVAGFLQDLRHGARMLVKNPGFAFIAIVSIALGVGANAAMFSLADGLVLRPVQAPRANELVSVRVFDLQGRLVQEYAVNVEANVDTEIDLQMGGLATGMYVGHVLAGPYAEVLRLVKQGR